MTPLVSVITRTLGRPCLADVAASLSGQTYRPLEWVVVDAGGQGLPELPPAAGVPARIVCAGRRLPRSQALNAGLAAAAGRYLLVLDDDDLIRADHVAHLVAALAAHPEVRAAYADAEAWDGEDSVSGRYEFEWSHLLLCRRNLFPPHAVLFDAALVRADGCRVDEGLEYFEDWDFWLQLARHTAFVRSARTTAIYRTHLSQSGVLGAAPAEALPRMAADRASVLARCADVRQELTRERERVLGRAYDAQARGDLAAAARDYVAALRADPQDVDTLNHYAELAMQAGDFRLARSGLEYAATLEPDEPTVHWNLALVLDALGLAPDAAAARARALALDPSLAAHAGAGRNEPQENRKRGQPQRRALRPRPAHDSRRRQLAGARLSLGRRHAALLRRAARARTCGTPTASATSTTSARGDRRSSAMRIRRSVRAVQEAARARPVVRRADRDRDRDGRDCCAACVPSIEHGAARVVGHRGDDVGAAARARLHRAAARS